MTPLIMLARSYERCLALPHRPTGRRATHQRSSGRSAYRTTTVASPGRLGFVAPTRLRNFEDTDRPAIAAGVEEASISLHALTTGITPRGVLTMNEGACVRGRHIVDSTSTLRFFPQFLWTGKLRKSCWAQRSNFQPCKGLSVAVANGDRMARPPVVYCPDMLRADVH